MTVTEHRQPRWEVYASTTAYPTNHGFIVWVSVKWREWERANGRPAGCTKSAADHEAFDRWIGAR